MIMLTGHTVLNVKHDRCSPHPHWWMTCRSRTVKNSIVWLEKYLWRPKKKSCCVKVRGKVLISNFRRVLNVVCFLLGESPASEIYMPTFRNNLFHLHRQVGACTYLPMKMEQTECSETSAYKFQTPGIHPKENIQQEVKLFCTAWSHMGKWKYNSIHS